MAFSIDHEPSPGRAPQRASRSPRGAQARGDASLPEAESVSPVEADVLSAPTRNREEGSGGSGERGLVSPDVSFDPASFDRQGDPSVTPPCKSNPGGEDWLEVSLYLDHHNFGELTSRLDIARKAAEEGHHGEDELKLGDQKFLVLPGGAKAGSKKKGVYYRWQLRSEDGLILQLMNRPHSHKTMPNGSLRATSLILMRLGAREVWRRGMAVLELLECTLSKNKLSRVDVCVDLADVPVATLVDPFVAGHYVSRARYGCEYFVDDSYTFADGSLHSLGRQRTGFTLGRDAMCVRVYDKMRESRGQMEKLETLASTRWGGYPFRASRVEFQIRRERLKEFGVDTVANWFDKRAEICQYVCTEWFRLTDGPVDRDHADRSKTLLAWQDVEAAFAAWAGIADYVAFEPLPSDTVPPNQLIQQAIGLFVSYLARSRAPIDGNEAFAHESMCMVLDHIENRDMASEVARRVLELGVKGPESR